MLKGTHLLVTRCQISERCHVANLINLTIECVCCAFPGWEGKKRQSEHSNQEKFTVEPCELACGVVTRQFVHFSFLPCTQRHLSGEEPFIRVLVELTGHTRGFCNVLLTIYAAETPEASLSDRTCHNSIKSR
jgi:hypothetical protein